MPSEYGAGYDAWAAACKARGGYAVGQKVDGVYVAVCRLPGGTRTDPKWINEPAPLSVQAAIQRDIAVGQIQMAMGKLASGAEAVLKPVRDLSKMIAIAFAALGALILLSNRRRDD